MLLQAFLGTSTAWWHIPTVLQGRPRSILVTFVRNKVTEWTACQIGLLVVRRQMEHMQHNSNAHKVSYYSSQANMVSLLHVPQPFGGLDIDYIQTLPEPQQHILCHLHGTTLPVLTMPGDGDCLASATTTYMASLAAADAAMHKHTQRHVGVRCSACLKISACCRWGPLCWHGRVIRT